MAIKNIFWDLDGTLTDSSEGITKCAKLALDHFGITQYEPSELKCFIGPPLRETFPKYGVPEDRVEEAISVFRGRYTTVGKFENKPYEGIIELLTALKEEGYKSYVATSKPEVTSLQIMEKFDLTQYFEIICGATMDGSRDTKDEVIKYLLGKTGGMKDVIMVGDTSFDVLGAAECGIKTIGVSWGFGSTDEMLAAGAVGIADSMEQLHQMIKTLD